MAANIRVIIADKLMAKTETDPIKISRDARLAVLELCDKFTREMKLNVSLGDKAFVSLYPTGGVKIPGWIKDEIKKLSVRTIARWRASVRLGPRRTWP